MLKSMVLFVATMSATEVNPVVFEDRYMGERTLFVPLAPTGETVTSITGTAWVGQDPSGADYYVKKRDNSSFEYQHLLDLRALGIPVPKVIATSADEATMATSASGRPLYEVFGDEQKTRTLLHAAGLLLRQIHHSLDTQPDLTLSRTYGATAHIVDCFFHKWIEPNHQVSASAYSVHKDLLAAEEPLQHYTEEDLPAARELPFIVSPPDAHPALAELVQEANIAATHYSERLAPYTVYYDPLSADIPGKEAHPARFIAIGDTHVCYGDYKPENILVNAEDAQQLRVIDPVFVKGNQHFDLAKFVSRFTLDTAEHASGAALESFFSGYGFTPELSKEIYGPFTFTDLVGMDMLNIVKTYVKKYAAGDKEYRLVRALDEPAFCNFVTRLLRTASVPSDGAKLFRDYPASRSATMPL